VAWLHAPQKKKTRDLNHTHSVVSQKQQHDKLHQQQQARYVLCCSKPKKMNSNSGSISGNNNNERDLLDVVLDGVSIDVFAFVVVFWKVILVPP